MSNFTEHSTHKSQLNAMNYLAKKKPERYRISFKYSDESNNVIYILEERYEERTIHGHSFYHWDWFHKLGEE